MADEYELDDELGGLGHNPLLDDDAVFAEMFGADPYAAPAPSAVPPLAAAPLQQHQQPVQAVRPLPRRRKRKAKPAHYRVVSFSLYQDDIDRLDGLVRELKKRGYTKANKSQLVRYALSTVDIDSMPRSI